MLIIKHGDIFEEFKNSTNCLLVHGCNCCNIMGAGIAAAISIKYPMAYDIDKAMHNLPNNKVNELMAGRYSIVPDFSNRCKSNYIGNLYTQLFPGKHFSYDLFTSCLHNLEKEVLKSFGIKKILMPAIGCGIGGGNFDYVVNIVMNWCRFNVPDIEVHLYYPQ